ECSESIDQALNQGVLGIALINAARAGISGTWSQVRHELSASECERVTELIARATSYQDLVAIYQHQLEHSMAIHAGLGESSEPRITAGGTTIQAYGLETETATRAAAVLSAAYTDGQ